MAVSHKSRQIAIIMGAVTTKALVFHSMRVRDSRRFQRISVRIIFEIYRGAYDAAYHYHKDNGHRNYSRHGFGAVINAYLHNYRRKIVEKMYQNARPHTARYRNGIAYGNTCDKSERNLNHIAVQKRKDKRRHNNRKPIAVFAKRLHNYAAHCKLLNESRQNSGFTIYGNITDAVVSFMPSSAMVNSMPKRF